MSKRLLMMSPRQAARLMANPSVTTMHYTMAFRDVRKLAGVPLDTMLGPLVEEPWQVGPDEIVRASTMVEAFLNMGLVNGVVYPTRFEVGLQDACLADSQTLSKFGIEAKLTISQMRSHIAAVLAMLRNYKRESHCKMQKKTSGLRKKCLVAYTKVIDGLVAKIDFTWPIGRSISPSAAASVLVASSPAHSVASSHGAGMDLQEAASPTSGKVLESSSTTTLSAFMAEVVPEASFFNLFKNKKVKIQQ